jgi:hypothetical protein
LRKAAEAGLPLYWLKDYILSQADREKFDLESAVDVDLWRHKALSWDQLNRRAAPRLYRIWAKTNVHRPPLITAIALHKLGACSREVDRFGMMWPKGARFTRNTLREAAKMELDIDWLGNKLLTLEAYRLYLPYKENVVNNTGFSLRDKEYRLGQWLWKHWQSFPQDFVFPDPE